jgi:hypothetical protein
MLAVTVRSQVETIGLMETAAALSVQFGFPHQCIAYDKLQNQAYTENTPNRCYVCKSTDLTWSKLLWVRLICEHLILKSCAFDYGFDSKDRSIA